MADNEVAETSTVPLQYMINSKGMKTQLIHEGYTYFRDNIYADKFYWRCTNKNCKGRAITLQEKDVITITSQHTDHKPSITEDTVYTSKEVKKVLGETEKNSVSQQKVKKSVKDLQKIKKFTTKTLKVKSKENLENGNKVKQSSKVVNRKVKVEGQKLKVTVGKGLKVSPKCKLSPKSSVNKSAESENVIDLTTNELTVKSEGGTKTGAKKLVKDKTVEQNSKKLGKVKTPFKRKTTDNEDVNSVKDKKIAKLQKFSSAKIHFKVKPVSKSQGDEDSGKEKTGVKNKEKKAAKSEENKQKKSVKMEKATENESEGKVKLVKIKKETVKRKVEGKQKNETRGKKRCVSDEVEVIDTGSDSDEDILYSISPESEDKKPSKIKGSQASNKDGKKLTPKKKNENVVKKGSPGKKNENLASKVLFPVKSEVMKKEKDADEKSSKLRNLLERKLEYPMGLSLPENQLGLSHPMKKMKLIDSMKSKEIKPMMRPVSPNSFFTTVKPIPSVHMDISKAGSSIPMCGDVPAGYQYYPAMIPISPSSLTYRMLLESLPQQLQKKNKKRENDEIEKDETIERRISVRQSECAYRYKEIVVIQEIVAALNSAKYDDSNLVMFSGLGNVFCNGIDLNYLISGDKKVAARKMVDALRDFTKAIITFPKPIVAVVTGQAVGLGMTMLPLCDIVYASDKATFYLPYAQLGQTPEGCATYTLPATIGMAMTNELLIAGRKITAIEACTLGLVSQVFWPTSIMQEVIPRVQNMALQSGKALETTKLLIRSHQRTKLELTNETESNLLLERWPSAECQRCIEDYLNNEKNFIRKELSILVQTSTVPLQYMINSKGMKTQLIHEGYTYFRDNIYADKFYWRCTNKNCKGRAITLQEKDVITITSQHTDHKPSITEDTVYTKNNKDSENARKMALKLLKKSKEVKKVLGETEKNSVSQQKVKKSLKDLQKIKKFTTKTLKVKSKENLENGNKVKQSSKVVNRKVKVEGQKLKVTVGKGLKVSPKCKLSPKSSVNKSAESENVIDLTTNELTVKSEGGTKTGAKKLVKDKTVEQNSKKLGKVKTPFKRKTTDNEDVNSVKEKKIAKLQRFSSAKIHFKVKPVSKSQGDEDSGKEKTGVKNKEKKAAKSEENKQKKSVKMEKATENESEGKVKLVKIKKETVKRKVEGKQKNETRGKKRCVSDEVEVIDTGSDSDEDILYSISPESEDKKPSKIKGSQASNKDGKKLTPKKKNENVVKKGSPGKKNENLASKVLFPVKSEVMKKEKDADEKSSKLRNLLERKLEYPMGLSLPENQLGLSHPMKKMKLIDSMKSKEIKPMMRPVSPNSFFTTVKPIPSVHMDISKAGSSIPMCGDVPAGYQYYPAMIPISPSSLTYRMLLESLPQQLQKKNKKRENDEIEKDETIERRISVRQSECAYRYKEIVVIQEIVAALNSAKYDDSNLVMFSGLGNVFCNGIDLNYLISGDKKVAARKMVDALRDFTKAIITFPKPIVAVVTGQAVGLGMTMLPLCDIVYASDKATFYLPYAQLGQTPEGCATYTLPATIGMAMTNELLIAGRKITAIEACTLGLVSQVFWPTSIMQEVIPRVQNMALQSGKALETTKLLIRSHQRTKLELTNETESNLLLERWPSAECQRCIEDYLNNEKNFMF
ncbi:hypothetical protein KUTeg_019241 [Tegillarca granosa]|uniref:FLYWCH-type domain-containing protein n=1 Tax=Tegillarca granosa TaxID=220873 RepID=A0ABQ9EH31_TEGGR|nr:hypothetical protein KUTeg_019241 [Tegillarca granosa]